MIRRKPFWKLGVLLHIIAAIRAIQFDRAEHAKCRHSLNLTFRRIAGKLRNITPSR